MEIELWPDTAVIKKGYRLRLDVQPYDGCGTERHSYDPSYHTGAENTIYTGAKPPELPAATRPSLSSRDPNGRG